MILRIQLNAEFAGWPLHCSDISLEGADLWRRQLTFMDAGTSLETYSGLGTFLCLHGNAGRVCRFVSHEKGLDGVPLW